MRDRSASTLQICFVDMPFGKKTDPKSGVEIDFDRVYEAAIAPAIRDAGLTSIRGDREESGGIIHKAMFARLLLSEFVIADLTTANANVFYELGVRHAARPYTTIPIFATIGSLPFDVSLVRAIPYSLTKGALTTEGAEALRAALGERIRRALEGPVAKDSPLFQLFEEFPGITISHELSDIFMDRIEVSQEFQQQLDFALESEPLSEAVRRLEAVERGLGDPHAVDHEILMKIFLTYRNVSAWSTMIALYGRFPATLQNAVIARQQLALALNRRNEPGDRDRALRILEELLEQGSESAETYGILGRVYKDQYKEADAANDPCTLAYLDDAIVAYTRGFECEPADYYPGVNAITLLIQKAGRASAEDEAAVAQEEAERLIPLVSFAVARRGGASSSDYWDLAAVFELAVIGRDYQSATSMLPRVLRAAEEGWMASTTADNLDLIVGLREEKEDTSDLERFIEQLRQRAASRPSWLPP